MVDDAFLNQYVKVSPRLAAVLDVTTRGGATRRFGVCDALAEQLNLPGSDDLSHATILLLAGFVEGLEQALAEGEGSWVDDVESDRHGRLARAAVALLDFEDLFDATYALGLARFQPPLQLRHLNELEPALRSGLVDFLKPRVWKMLDQWRRRGAWHPDLAKGIVPIRRGEERRGA